ncbi:guanine-1-methyltransferase-domain-containing protein [Blastocladiella britannica]|nr:guanine-1-methyltransferase-domain-containing protein [Blastocladiella britannica]
MADNDTPTTTISPVFEYLDDATLATMSKNARKRYLKEKKWHEARGQRAENRKLERARAKERKRERRALGTEPMDRLPRVNVNREQTGVRVVIDLDFKDMMNLKEAKSLCKQLSFCYSANRRHSKSVNLLATGMSSEFEAIMLTQWPTFRSWADLPIFAQGFMDMTTPAVTTDAETEPALETTKPAIAQPLFPPHIDRASLVYLSGDSPNVLTTLDPTKTYVIGGLVDHNRYRNYCLDRAESLGIAHAAFPIGEFIALRSRRILAVNHCVEIMVRVLENGGDWKDALETAIPDRKKVVRDGAGASDGVDVVNGEAADVDEDECADAVADGDSDEVDEENDDDAKKDIGIQKRPRSPNSAASPDPTDTKRPRA